MMQDEGRRRVVIEGVKPQIDGGRFAIKRTVGESVVVEADIFTDGHDAIAGALRYRKTGASQWSEVPMTFLSNDRWRAAFSVTEIGRYTYTLIGWVDHFKTWRGDLRKRVEAGQDVTVDLQIGANLIEDASKRASDNDAAWLRLQASTLRNKGEAAPHKIKVALDDQMARVMERYPDRCLATTYERELDVVVDPKKARFSAWYEMFPRSGALVPGEHGTFQDCEARLPYIAGMGFDVLYFPPIHPIGVSFRKGKNNTLTAEPDDVGSPWAIGSAEGGHTAIHPQLGTLEDFRRLVAKAREYDLDIALDIAFQCSPDHPYVKAHPEWFRMRPDGTIQYAENPPKKYQDIYPFDFETRAWQPLWEELKNVFLFWVKQGVSIFRVDNPHTKPFAFWEWVIREVKQAHPETIFLAEAFTRPKVMYNLAKLGFTQSYTYFAWRNTKWDLTQYLTELTRTEVREFFRPNFWPNTPDILNEYLQVGGRPAFMIRLVLAATLAANYGIYGPAFELCINTPREPGSEEYLDSEKYELKSWDLESHLSLQHVITQVNRIRRENPALQHNGSLRFHQADNERIICYSKQSEDGTNTIVVVISLDPYYTQAGWLDLPLEELGFDPGQTYQMHDLLSDARYLWHGPHNYVELHPYHAPAHIFRMRRHIRTEHDFDYYM
ncbi:MAG: alpha-1,4-glucan--maltose-1-phosphate maltosyltransferase [Chloroflexaceae bacterium]|nr:alpha-1,4-glucan--maltose-1-phosphate maltosyltransferase [Chloroflexaceae bacterium]